MRTPGLSRKLGRLFHPEGHQAVHIRFERSPIEDSVAAHYGGFRGGYQLLVHPEAGLVWPNEKCFCGFFHV